MDTGLTFEEQQLQGRTFLKKLGIPVKEREARHELSSAFEQLQLEVKPATVRRHSVLRGTHGTCGAAGELLAKRIETRIAIDIDPEAIVRIKP